MAEWTCIRCTLINTFPAGENCLACNWGPGSELPQLQPQPDLTSSGAILGALIGGTRAYLRDTSISRGAVAGSVAGGVAGSVLTSLQPHSQPAPNPTPIPQPSFNQFLQMVNGSNNPMQAMMQTMMMDLGGNSGLLGNFMNTDGMSYEAMLDMFGDGGEAIDRSASKEVIDSLPTQLCKVVNLKEGRECCSVCLEDFKDGDQMKNLPCNHDYHVGCIDQWLATNATCPVCKASVKDYTAGGITDVD